MLGRKGDRTARSTAFYRASALQPGKAGHLKQANRSFPDPFPRSIHYLRRIKENHHTHKGHDDFSQLAKVKHVPTERANLETSHALLAEVKNVPTKGANLETSALLKDTREPKNWQCAEIQRMKKNIREIRAQYLRKDPELMEALHIIREIMKDDLPLTSEQ